MKIEGKKKSEQEVRLSKVEACENVLFGILFCSISNKQDDRVGECVRRRECCGFEEAHTSRNEEVIRYQGGTEAQDGCPLPKSCQNRTGGDGPTHFDWRVIAIIGDTALSGWWEHMWATPIIPKVNV